MPTPIPAHISLRFAALSFVCMLGVVLGHAYNLPMRYLQPWTTVGEALTFNRFVQFFCANGLIRPVVPLFFLMSGYLNLPSSTEPHSQKIWKRAKSLLVPYLLWSYIGLCTYALMDMWPYGRTLIEYASLGSFSNMRILDYNWQQLLYRWIMEPIPFQLWFLRVLFVYTALSPWLVKAVARYPIATLSTFSVLWFTGFGTYFVEGDGLFFFTLGLWIRQRGIDLEHPAISRHLPWMAVLWITLLLVKAWLAFQCPHLNGLQFILFRLSQPMGVYVLWCSSLHWAGLGRLAAFSKYNLVVYGFHVPILYFVTDAVLLTHAPAGQWLHLGVFFGSFAAVAAVCVLLGKGMRMIMPSIAELMTGGRL